MLVPPDSPLRNLPANMPPVQIVSFEALRFALEMTNIVAVRLFSSLEAISLAAPQPPTQEACMGDAWAMADHVWRLAKLLERARGLKQTPELKSELRALRQVEGLRHHYEHMEREILAAADHQKPLWGTLSWVWWERGADTFKSFTMLPGSPRDGLTGSILNPAGKQFTHPLDLVTLDAAGVSIDLSGLWRRVQHIAHLLDIAFRQAVPADAAGGGADIVFTAEMRVVETPPESAQVAE